MPLAKGWTPPRVQRGFRCPVCTRYVTLEHLEAQLDMAQRVEALLGRN